MKRAWRWLLRGLFYAALVADGLLVVGMLAYRLAHPELTETQLLIRWWVAIVFILALNLAAYYGASRAEQERG